MTVTPRTDPFTSEFRGKLVTFRPMFAADKESYRSFIRSLPAKDNYYLLVDVRDDGAIDHWAKQVAAGHTVGVFALEAQSSATAASTRTNCRGRGTPARCA